MFLMKGGCSTMTSREYYNAVVEMVENKIAPLCRLWGLEVKDRSIDGGHHWVFSNQAGDRHEAVTVVEEADGVRLWFGLRQTFVCPQEWEKGDEALLQWTERRLRRVLENFVAQLAWKELPVVWTKKGRCLSRRTKQQLLSLEFSLGKRTWTWTVTLTEFPQRGFATPPRRLAVIRQPISVNPITTGVNLVKAEGLLYL
jgi:hypothetical protein